MERIRASMLVIYVHNKEEAEAELALCTTQLTRATTAVDELLQSMVVPRSMPPPGSKFYVEDVDMLDDSPDRHPSGFARECTMLEPNYGVAVIFRANVSDLTETGNTGNTGNIGLDLLELRVEGNTRAVTVMQAILDAKPGDEIVLTREMFVERWHELVAAKRDPAGLTTISRLENTDDDDGSALIGDYGAILDRVFNIGRNAAWEPIRGTIITTQPICRAMYNKRPQTRFKLSQMLVPIELNVKLASKRK